MGLWLWFLLWRSLLETLETLDFTIHIGSTPTFLYFDLYLNTAYAALYVYYMYIYICICKLNSCLKSVQQCSMLIYADVTRSFTFTRSSDSIYIYIYIYIYITGSKSATTRNLIGYWTKRSVCITRAVYITR